MENWKPLLRFEGWYEISDLGRIRNVRPGKGRQFGRILQSYPTGYGYHETSVYMNGVERKVAIHREVMKAFIGPYPAPGMEINHKDGIKSNNQLPNLEYVTPMQNCHHAMFLGLKPTTGRYRVKNGLKEALCCKCRIWKEITFFRKYKITRCQSYCNSCANQTNYLYRARKKLKNSLLVERVNHVKAEEQHL